MCNTSNRQEKKYKNSAQHKKSDEEQQQKLLKHEITLQIRRKSKVIHFRMYKCQTTEEKKTFHEFGFEFGCTMHTRVCNGSV